MSSAGRPFFIVNAQGVVRRGERYPLSVGSEREAHAPGTLSSPGGEVAVSGAAEDTLEHTLAREIREETGVGVNSRVYLESKGFSTDDSEPALDTVFLREYTGGDAKIGDADEIAEVAAHAKAPAWTRGSIEKAERVWHGRA